MMVHYGLNRIPLMVSDLEFFSPRKNGYSDTLKAV